MTTMEIVLLVVGGIAVFLSFILPEGKKKTQQSEHRAYS